MKRLAGFTIIEFLFVIAISGILAAIAIPSFKYVTSSNRVAQEINGLLGDLQYARAEAIKEGFWVTMCASTTGTSCSNTATWNTGWIIFADTNNSQTVTAGELLLRVGGAFSGTDTLLADNSMTAVTFNREGFAAMYAGSTTAITASPVTLKLNTAPQNTQWERCLAITTVGGTTSTEKYGGNCN